MLAFTSLGDLGGTTATFAAAQVVAEAIARDDWPAAVIELGKFSGAELIEVGQKAIAIGADPITVQMLIDTLGGGAGEIIEVTGTAPILTQAKAFPWLLVLLALGVGTAGYLIYRSRKA